MSSWRAWRNRCSIFGTRLERKQSDRQLTIALRVTSMPAARANSMPGDRGARGIAVRYRQSLVRGVDLVDHEVDDYAGDGDVEPQRKGPAGD